MHPKQNSAHLIRTVLFAEQSAEGATQFAADGKSKISLCGLNIPICSRYTRSTSSKWRLNMAKMLTIKEVSERLRINCQSVQRLIKNKTIPAIRLPGTKKWLISEDDLKKILS